MLAYCRLMLCFNYRARGGHDQKRRATDSDIEVSTTVPAEGTTYTDEQRKKEQVVSTTVPAEGTT